MRVCGAATKKMKKADVLGARNGKATLIPDIITREQSPSVINGFGDIGPLTRIAYPAPTRLEWRQVLPEGDHT